jgi:ankyrin repeat protein
LSKVDPYSFFLARTRFVIPAKKIMVWNRIVSILVPALFAICLAKENSDIVSDDFLNACTEGDLDQVERALSLHPSWVNGRSENGETCLHVAGIKGQSHVSRLIIQKGGDVNIRSEFSAGLRMHPLSWNVYGGHLENVRILLEEGNADINLDYDNAKGTPITVLDTILEIVPDEKEIIPDLERFYQLKALLKENGAKRFKDLNR